LALKIRSYKYRLTQWEIPILNRKNVLFWLCTTRKGWPKEIDNQASPEGWEWIEADEEVALTCDGEFITLDDVREYKLETRAMAEQASRTKPEPVIRTAPPIKGEEVYRTGAERLTKLCEQTQNARKEKSMIIARSLIDAKSVGNKNLTGLINSVMNDVDAPQLTEVLIAAQEYLAKN
jgi:hypothetical protein